MQNFDNFLKRSDCAKRSIGASIKNCWYRGQSNPYPLNCSLSRFYQDSCERGVDLSSNVLEILPIEESIYCDFSHRNGEYRSSAFSSWEILAAMQHYGAPTRLLDWSESMLVAIYFALEKAYDASSEQLLQGYTPTIYFLNPYKLSEQSKKSGCSSLPDTYFTDKNKVWNVTISSDLDYLDNLIIKKSWHFDSPVPIYAPWSNPRIIAQQGCFTFHGLDLRPLDQQEQSNNSLSYVQITDSRVARDLWKVLEMHNFTKYQIFQDHVSLANEMRRKYIPMPNNGRQ